MNRQLITDITGFKFRLSEHLVSCIPGQLGKSMGICRKAFMGALAEAVGKYNSEESPASGENNKTLESIIVE